MQYWPTQAADFMQTAGQSGRSHSSSILRRAVMALLLLVVAMITSLHAGSAWAEEDFLDPDQAFVFSAASRTPTELAVHFKVAPKYYMYRERFAFAAQPEAAAPALGAPVFPRGLVKYDPTFEKDLEVYYDQVTIRLPLQPGAATQPFTLAVTSQGCADAGLCYPPMTTELTLTPVDGGYSASGKGVVQSVPEPRDYQAGADGKPAASAMADAAGSGGFADAFNLGDTGLASYLAQAGWAEIVLMSLLLGVLLSFTPCVLPMVPILLAILAGDAGRGRLPASPQADGGSKTGVTGRRSRWRGVSLAAVFVLGMSLVYTALGVAAGLVGASLAIWLQTPWVLVLFALLLTLLALPMFDVYTLQAPVRMQTALNERLSRIPGGRHGGVFLMGMISALIVGPCVAAPLAGVLLFISQTGDVALGGTALFAMAWGEGLLLLAVGASSGVLLPKAGPWMDGVKRLFGVLLLATAWWMVAPVIPAWLNMLGWALLALWSAAMLGAFESVREVGAGRLLNKAIGLVLAVWATTLLVGMAAGGRDVLRPLAPFSSGAVATGSGMGTGVSVPGAQAVKDSFTKVYSVAELDNLLANTDRPVMLDFYADWCVSCIQMERFTFSDAGVAEKMSQLLLVQADVTKNTPDDRALLKRFDLFGPPGIIFFDAKGAQREDARVVGFKDASDFGAVLDRVLAGG